VIVIPYGHDTHTRMNHSNRRGVSRISVLTTLPTPAGVGIFAWATGSGGEQDPGPSRPASTGDRGHGYLGHQSRAREDRADCGYWWWQSTETKAAKWVVPQSGGAGSGQRGCGAAVEGKLGRHLAVAQGTF
jgi:hypothetical protein